jgi:GNAT superfamily N-acetyltransferase
LCEDRDVPARVAHADDIDEVTAILAGAFAGDPLWSWAVADDAQRARLWRFMVTGAVRYPHIYLAEGGHAAATWIPPGGTELSHQQEAQLPQLIEQLSGTDHAPAVMELFHRFEIHHPDGAPHYYLSLLGTHPEHRGKGAGMGLLADNLAAFDAEGVATYLESSNPVNIPRYEAVGYRAVGSFTTPDDRHTVTQMWRDAA